ncbi:MAG: shikimate dehydrogenase [Pseudomonadota bacterium]
MMQNLYVIGDPIEQSLSPTIHNLWIDAAGLNAKYHRLLVPQGQAAQALARLSAEGAIGVNVTMPHKHAALEISKSASPQAQLIGAANTLTALPEGGWHADNTDAPGVLTALGLAGIETISERRILVIGAGGAARAVVQALHGAGANLIILNRTEQRAVELSNSLTGGAARAGGLAGIGQESDAADLVVNASGAGYQGETLALPPGQQRLFFDISYGPAVTAQLSSAQRAGWRTEDGLGMLVAQAAESFHIWFGEQPDLESALRVCRAAVEGRA